MDAKDTRLREARSDRSSVYETELLYAFLSMIPSDIIKTYIFNLM